MNQQRESRRRFGPLLVIAAWGLALLLAPATASAADPALKGAWGFEEGSGTMISDASGSGNPGTISGATWTTAGRFGSALDFDGVNDMVSIADADSLDFVTALTLEAWVRPTEMTKYRTVVLKEATTSLAYATYSETSKAQPSFQLQMEGRLRGVNGPSQLPVNTWTHLAATFDGVIFRLYVNGTEVASVSRRALVATSSGSLRIGGNTIFSEWFKGLIDEVRVYNRALTAGEIQLDMNTPISSAPDRAPPTAPGGFLVTGSSPTTLATAWAPASDDRGVAGYSVYLGNTKVAETTQTSYTFTGLPCNTSHTLGVEAFDDAGNISSPRTELTASTAVCDTTPPSTSISQPAADATVSGTVALSANAADDDAVAGVQFLVDGQNQGAEDTTAPYTINWGTRGLTNGAHTIAARARDRSGNSATSTTISVNVDNSTIVPPGLRAGYGFDENQGTTVEDISGNDNNGTLVNGPSWAAGGKFGAALDFDGVDDGVTIPDANSLDLTSGMTLSAWIKPDVLNGSWRTVLFKERTGNLVYGIYAQEGLAVPNGEVTSNGTLVTVRGTSQLPVGAWSYLALTYDGTNLRMYLNGALVSSALRVGTMAASTGDLKIGGNGIWGERFDGLIDEVRVYDRALPVDEIQSDMNSSVATPDRTPPSAPGTLTANGGTGKVTLNWGPATDDAGVTRYDVFRSTTSGFTPSTSNRVGQPTATTFVDTGLAAGTYHYRVVAIDRVGNSGPPSNQASATASADTTPPTVSLTAPLSGVTVSGTVQITADASDDQAISSVQFLLDGQPLGSEVTSAPWTMAWNSRLSPNGQHVLRARARDAAGNLTTSGPVDVTVDSTLAPPPGLVAGFGFEEATGTTTSDASGSGNSGTLEGGVTHAAIGKFGRGLRFDGVDDVVTVPDAASLDLTTGMTVSGWVKPDQIDGAWRTLLMKEHPPGTDAYGFYAADGTRLPNGEINTGTLGGVKGTSAPSLTGWTHLALTFDGSTIRMYADGVLVGTQAKTGSLVNSAGPLRIGGNKIWPNEYFKGLIDEVRVYNRALPQAEIQTDMLVGVARDTTAPTVAAVTPGETESDIPINPSITARFSEPMDPATLSVDTVALRDPANTVVSAAITYDELSATVRIRPNAALRYGTRYTATVRGGTSGLRARDRAGNALPADRTWSFTTEPAPPPMLLVTSSANPFSTYAAELLKAEGLNEYAAADVTLVDRDYLDNFRVVVLGDVAVTSDQVTALTSWVNAGGNLIALRPDKKLASLLGITDVGTQLTNGYIKVDTSQTPGSGIAAPTMQFHGSADRYALSGARAVATLYSDMTTATTSPAVTTRDVGTEGGQASAFAYDLAKSVSLTRQGNPAWVGQNRDGKSSVRSNDLFWGNMLTDPQLDWVQTARIHIPQADEQQRLLANIIFDSTLDTQPLPRFWYLPRGEKAAIVMTGDDHARGGTAPRFDQYLAASSPGCSVALWQCVRGTSYIYPASPITDAQAAAYVAQGFEVSLHVNKGGCTDFTASQLADRYALQLGEFAANYPSVPAPATERTHCTTWTDWASQAHVQVANGISMDTNYYHYPNDWALLPGFMTGSGMPMKFADLDGTTIDDYQAATQMDDEAEQPYPATVNTLLDRALGPEGYYGAFVTLMHTDQAVSAGSDAIVASAQARNVPIITTKQLLDWTRGRDGSSFKQMTWDGSVLQFAVRAGTGSTGLQAMLPTASVAGSLSAITLGGNPVPFTVKTVKGIQYAFFAAGDGTYRATYG